MIIEAIILSCLISVPADCGSISKNSQVVSEKGVSFVCNSDSLPRFVKLPENTASNILISYEVRPNQRMDNHLITYDCVGIVP